MKYVGYNKFLKGIIYCTIGPDNKLYLKSANPQMFHLEKVTYSGIFENSEDAAKMSCEENTETNCDPLDSTYPLEDALIPLAIELIVKELTGAAYKPKDEQNNANDELSGLGVKK